MSVPRLLTALAVCMLTSQRVHAQFCDASPTSRWSTAGATYHSTGTYGTGENEWLVTITGIAASSDRVFVYDGASASIHVLDTSLKLLHRFGRKGEGPGELSVPPFAALDAFARQFPSNAIVANDSLLFVYDGSSLQSFRHDGTFVEYIARLPTMPTALLRLHVAGKAVLYALDSLDLRGTQGHRLQTWRIGAATNRLVHSAAMLPLPVADGTMSRSTRDPFPLWGMYRTCIAWADGAMHRVMRTVVGTSAVDTVALPPHEVLPFEERRPPPPPIPGRRGQVMRAPERPDDAPLRHWSALVIDPDGHIWVQPWTRDGKPEGPVYRIDAAGAVHEERVPLFPLAFGPPGVFYARDVDPDTDEVVIIRFERRR